MSEQKVEIIEFIDNSADSKNEFLEQFLNAQIQRNIVTWEPGDYQFYNRKFKLNCRLNLYRKKIKTVDEEGKEKITFENHYAVINLSKENQLGKGTFGEVWAVYGTLGRRSNDKFLFQLKNKPNKQYLIKIQQNNFDLAKREGEIAASIPAYHAQKTVIGQNNKDNKEISNLFERRFKGKNLYKAFIKPKQQNQSSKLSIKQRFKISINFLRALKEIHDRGIIHGDIKPENIIVDLDTFEVRIIDFGLSKFANAKFTVSSGSLQYMAHEVLYGNSITKASDIWSASITLWELWTGTSIIDPKQVTYDKEINKIALGKEILKIPEKLNNDKNSIKYEFFKIIKAMAKIHPTHRQSLEASINQFEKAYITFKLKNIKNKTIKQKKAIEIAHMIGAHVLEQLKKIEIEEKNIVPRISNAIKQGLASIDETPNAIKEFLTVLNIKALNPNELKTKQAVLKKVEKLFEDFEKSYNNLFDLMDYCEENEKTKELVYLQRLANKHNNKEATLDDIVILTEIWNKQQSKDLFEHRFKQKFKKLILIRENKKNFGKIDNKWKTIAEKFAPADVDNRVIEDLVKEKQKIRGAVLSYIEETYTEKNIRKKDRAASEKRQKDIVEILDSVNEAKDIGELEREISKKLSRFGFFDRVFRRSTLYCYVEAALEDVKSARKL